MSDREAEERANNEGMPVRPSDEQTIDKREFEQWLRESMQELDKAWTAVQRDLGPIRDKILAEQDAGLSVNERASKVQPLRTQLERSDYEAAASVQACKLGDTQQPPGLTYNTSNMMLALARASTKHNKRMLLALAVLVSVLVISAVSASVLLVIRLMSP